LVVSLLAVEKLLAILEDNRRIRKSSLPSLTVKSSKKGLEIWNLKPVKRFFFEKSLGWIPRNNVAVFIPCSAWKPYPYSQSHKYGYLKALRPALHKIDLFVVSEPMGIVPYCYSDEYPVDGYDYDPNRFFIGKLRKPLVRKALEIFTDRLAIWIKKYHNKYKKRILILPKSWHLKVFEKALRKIGVSPDQYSVVTICGRASNSVRQMQEQLQNIGLY